MITELILIGPHGAGKTTLGVELARALGVPFHEEIGRRLAADPALRPPARGPAEAQPFFDARVFEEELARDRRWPSGQGRIIESWHPGNLGFASLRSPATAERYLPAVRAAVLQRAVLVLPLRAPAATLQVRRTEQADTSFFVDVAARAEGWARALGLPVAEPIDTCDGGPTATLARALELLATRGVTP